MSDSFFERQIAAKGQQLTTHPLYKHLQSLNDLRTFMEFHVFAVWDFMSLVKRLQREFTTINLPWQPSPYPEKLVRTVNEIVLSEESDLDPHGQPMSHFNMYITAMDEVGANTQPIYHF